MNMYIFNNFQMDYVRCLFRGPMTGDKWKRVQATIASILLIVIVVGGFFLVRYFTREEQRILCYSCVECKEMQCKEWGVPFDAQCKAAPSFLTRCMPSKHHMNLYEYEYYYVIFPSIY